MKDKKALTAPCGLDCFNCEIYEDNLTSDLAEWIHEKVGAPKQEIPCKGCHQQDGKHYHLPPEGCAALHCVKGKGVELCCDCDDFPCAFLAPTASEEGRRIQSTAPAAKPKQPSSFDNPAKVIWQSRQAGRTVDARSSKDGCFRTHPLA